MSRPARALSHSLVFALLALVTSRPAHADSRAAAEALFAAGRLAMKNGDTRAACEKFRESDRLDPAAGTKLNLAVCRAELGDLAGAWQLLTALDKSLEKEDPRRELVRSWLARFEPRLPHVRIEASATLPAGALVRAGSLEISPSGFGVAIPLNPGSHTFVLSAPGWPARRYEVSLAEGDDRVLSVELPRRVSPVRKEASPSSPWPSQRGWGAIALGAAGAAFVASALFGLQVLNEKQTMKSHCDASGCSQLGLDAAERGGTYARVSTASFVGGLALTGLGTTLLLVEF